MKHLLYAFNSYFITYFKMFFKQHVALKDRLAVKMTILCYKTKYLGVNGNIPV